MVQVARTASASFAGDVSPNEAWEALSQNNKAELIDVRTHAEWVFSGMPNLESLGKSVKAISWKFYPNFDLNPQFLEQLEAAVPDKSVPLYFLCKTGGRSTDAAIAATAAGYVACYNVASGFEGDSNQFHQRGSKNGWKAAQLPWQQA
jgi:rhodanese-related sulfurtransferase